MWAQLADNRYTTIMGVIAAVAALILPAPLGADYLFSYGLAALGAFVGIIFASAILNQHSIKLLSIILFLLLLAVVFGTAYYWLLYNIRTPSIFELVAEAVCYALFFACFFCLSRIADVRSRDIESKN
jgi:hypothetical protein